MNAMYIDLLNRLESLESAVVAFSGGVDSTFLLYACKQALGSRVVAVTIDTPYVTRWEIEESKKLVEMLGVRHEIIKMDMPKELANNPQDRCYICKKSIFTEMIKFKDSIDYKHILDGSNIDDIKDFSPGMAALRELEVVSPLMDCGLGKREIRELSKQQRIATWNKPAYACLLCRMPHDILVTEKQLEMIEKSEKYVIDKGFSGAVVKKIRDTAKIELREEDIHRIFKDGIHEEIDLKLKEFGFSDVAVDLVGYNKNK